MRLNRVSQSYRWILVIAVGLVCALLTSASEHLTEQPPLYGYLTAHDIVIMRGTKVVTRASYDRTSGAGHGGLVWTLDHRYAAAIADSPKGDADARTIVVLNIVTGEVRRMPCHECTNAAPIGADSLVAAQQSRLDADGWFDSMLRFQLGKSAPPVQLSPRFGDLEHVQLLGGSHGEAYALGFDQTKDLEVYLKVQPDGSVHRFATRPITQDTLSSAGDTEFGVGSIAIAMMGSKPLIAVDTLSKSPSNSCRKLAHIFLLSPVTGESIDTDVSHLTPKGHTAGVDAAVIAGNLWWDRDGTLHAIMASWQCKSEAEKSAQLHDWSLNDGVWQRGSSEPMAARVDLADGDATLENGALAVTADGFTKTVASHDVLNVSTPVTDRPLPSRDRETAASCLLHAAIHVGTRTGDLDGDGKNDRISLDLCRAEGIAHGGHKLVAKMTLADGGQLKQAVSRNADQGAVKWVGISDVNGDGRGEVFVVDVAGPHSQHVLALEFRDGRLTLVPGGLGQSLYLDSSLSTNSGFRCKTVRGHRQVVVTSADIDSTQRPARYVGEEETFQATSTGEMKKIMDKPVSYPALPNSGWYRPSKQVDAFVGAHCRGLVVMPNGS